MSSIFNEIRDRVSADADFARILLDVIYEGDRAQAKHSTPTPNPMRGITIETEELGEAAEAALKLTSINVTEREGQGDDYWLAQLRAEWVQVASVAIRQIENIDNGRMGKWVMKEHQQTV